MEKGRRKQQPEPDISIFVRIDAEPLCVTVCDSGDAIPEAVAVSLMRRVVVSENGLGVGLYQAARWAEQQGYRLTLTGNQRGNVCFELRCLMPQR